METEKLNHYLKTLGRAVNIPITFGRFGGGVSFFEPFDITGGENGLEYIAGKITPIYDNFSDENVIYCVTPSLIMMGMVFNRTSGEFIFVGPIASQTTSEKEIENYLKKANLSEDTTYKLAKYMLNSRTLDQNNLIELLSNINLIFNGEIRQPYEIVAAYDAETPDRIAFAYREYDRETAKQDKKDVENAENYNLMLNNFILNGDIEGLTDFLNKAENPLLAAEDYRGNISELKVIAFNRVFMAEVIALKSGISSADLEQTQRFYLRKINAVASENELNKLTANATLDFAKKVKEYLNGKAENPTINHAVAFIKNNITVKLTPEYIAKAVKTNKRYLFANFKRETGKTLVEFINEEKIKKACYYLQFTDKSLAEISSSLSFSSQSYFQSVFKKIMGKTPFDWRKTNMYFK